jgi:predicted RNA-binding protein with PIN domain
LIDSLIEYRKRKGHNITVVFDGWKTGRAQENHSVIGEIKVIYSRLGERADSVIKRLISSGKRGWIVVTSDRDIASYAWASGSVPISSEDFLSAIEKKESVEGVSYDEDSNEEHVKPGRKGNPKKPSKKEKAIKKTLSKL